MFEKEGVHVVTAAYVALLAQKDARVDGKGGEADAANQQSEKQQKLVN